MQGAFAKRIKELEHSLSGMHSSLHEAKIQHEVPELTGYK